MADWHAAGVPLVILTHGEHGAAASTPLGLASVGAPPVAVVDTVGAGDAFMSGHWPTCTERGPLSATPWWTWTLQPDRAPETACLVARTRVRGLGQSRLAVASSARSLRVLRERSRWAWPTSWSALERWRRLAKGTCLASPGRQVPGRARSPRTLSTSSALTLPCLYPWMASISATKP